MEDSYNRKYEKESGLSPDVYRYDEIPKKLRITLSQIFKREINTVVKNSDKDNTNNKIQKIYEKFKENICEEFGLQDLSINNDDGEFYSTIANNYEKIVLDFLVGNEKKEIGLYIIGLLCRKIFRSHTQNFEILNKINQRMLEHGFGYQFENGEMIRIDTKHTHSEIVKPAFALLLLQDNRFEPADDYYRAGFQAFNKGDYANVFVLCNKAFEATMKIICEINNFQDKKTIQDMAASALIKILCDSKNKFLKNYDNIKLDGLKKILSSISTLRNKEGAHGKSSKDKPIEVSYVNYALHATAANILFLLERQREFER